MLTKSLRGQVGKAYAEHRQLKWLAGQASRINAIEQLIERVEHRNAQPAVLQLVLQGLARQGCGSIMAVRRPCSDDGGRSSASSRALGKRRLTQN